MVPIIDNFLREKMASHMIVNHPQFKRTPTRLTGGLAGCDVYVWKINSTNTGWLIFGGNKKGDRDVIADLAWTRSGKKLVGLDYLDWWTIPSTYPDDGACKLTYSGVVGKDFEGSRSIEIEAPSKDFQELALKKYGESDKFRKLVEFSTKKILEKNPGLEFSMAESEAVDLNTNGSRPFFKLWSRCSESIELSETDLERIVQPALTNAICLFDKYGLSFLEERLK
jgi:hypothetical protein